MSPLPVIISPPVESFIILSFLLKNSIRILKLDNQKKNSTVYFCLSRVVEEGVTLEVRKKIQ